MLPWEHVAVGYLLYSAWVHLRHRRRPDGPTALVVAFATVLPDLIDKPLGWSLGVLPSVGLGHSLFFAVTVVLLTWTFAGGRYALPLGVGVLSHLAGDVFFKTVVGGELEYSFLFWPVVDRPPSDAPGLLSQTRYWISEFAAFVTSPEGMAYLGFEVALLGTAFLLWVYDGFPGLAPESFRRRADTATDY